VSARTSVDNNALVRQIALGGGIAIAISVGAMLLRYPTDPNPDWPDIFQEWIFFAAGLAALWAAWRVDSPRLMAGVVLLTMSFGLEVADEFVIETPFIGNQAIAAVATSGLALIAWALAGLGVRQQQGRISLQSSEERFQLLFDLCPIPLTVTQLTGEFIAVNSAFERRTGYRREGLVGKTPWEIGISDRAPGETITRKLGEPHDAPVRQPMQVRTRMGALYDMIVTADLIELPEGPAIITASYNVTEQESLLRELERYQGQLEVAAMKDEFVATMSYKLQTPLTAVIAAAHSLEGHANGPLTAPQRASLNAINEHARQLLAIINDILELSRLDGGRGVVQREPVNIAAACDDAWASITEGVQKKWIEANMSIAKDLESLFTDPRRLKSILTHLLDNAVKFTPPGGRIGLDVAADQAKGVVAFTVWDSGPGIPVADQPRLFQPFVQLQTAPSSDTSGSGLGLAIVRRTARALGGDAYLESSPGAGSKFTVFLPLNPPAA
jgi:PAS domain S-box-containing protein